MTPIKPAEQQHRKASKGNDGHPHARHQPQRPVNPGEVTRLVERHVVSDIREHDIFAEIRVRELLNRLQALGTLACVVRGKVAHAHRGLRIVWSAIGLKVIVLGIVSAPIGHTVRGIAAKKLHRRVHNLRVAIPASGHDTRGRIALRRVGERNEHDLLVEILQVYGRRSQQLIGLCVVDVRPRVHLDMLRPVLLRHPVVHLHERVDSNERHRAGRHEPHECIHEKRPHDRGIAPPSPQPLAQAAKTASALRITGGRSRCPLCMALFPQPIVLFSAHRAAHL